MIDFNKFLVASASPVAKKGAKSGLFAADLRARNDNTDLSPILWRCSHHHATQAEAVACAAAALRCDDGTDLANQLDAAVRCYFVVK